MTLITESATINSTLFTRDHLFIGGQWVNPSGTGRIHIIDPNTEEIIGSVPEANEEDAEKAIAAAVTAFASSPWRDLSYLERADYLLKIADELEARSDDVAQAYVHDFGGLITNGKSLAARGAVVLRTHLLHARELRQEPERRTLGGIEALIVREPVGPVLGIVPWNSTFPITLVKLAPALLAGCPAVIKIAVESPLNSFLIADAIEAAGLPAGLVSFLPARRESLGAITTRPEFRHISFTGSTAAGIAIMKEAAENVTDVTLELGGKSPGIILEDLDPIEDVHLVLPGTMGQAGQVCMTYSRLLIPRSKEKQWRESLTNFFGNLVVGDPSDPATEVGPLVTKTHRRKVEEYIQIARDEGATILTGGSRPDGIGRGYFVSPTLVGDVTQDMRIVREEVFGPVITLQAYDTIQEAIDLANDTDYGLAAGIFTHEEEVGLALASKLDAGTVSINLAATCPLMPFGGYKKSGLGREGGLEGVEALLEYKQIQLRRV